MTVVSAAVASSADDWFIEWDGTPAFDNTNPTNYVGYLTATDYYQSGFRFASIAIPKAATITQATITAKAFTIPSGVLPFSFVVLGCAADNAAAPTDYATHVALPRTAAQVIWTPSAWVTGTVYTSPDISPVIQEIVNRPGWVSGNALVILFQQPAVFSANGSLRISSYDSAPANAAVISVTYADASSILNPSPGSIARWFA